MADSTTGGLPAVEEVAISDLPNIGNLYDDTLIPVEQQGAAMHMTGKQWAAYGAAAGRKAAEIITQGPPGKDGRDFVVKGYYETLDDLQADQPAPEEGDTYGVGAAAPYDFYTWDAVHQEWVNNGPISGPQGKQGDPGKDGTSPTAAVSKVGKVTTLTVTDANGTTTSDIKDGADGKDGEDFKILGYYDSLTDLQAAVTNPGAGDAYGVGLEAPYDIYIYDGVNNVWKNNGSIQGPAGADGKPGESGAPGADGRGISSTAVTYQAGTSGTTAPTGTWSSSIPSVSAGDYLWTRTIVTYTDDTTTTIYSVAKMGNDGAAGATGATGATGAPGAKGDPGLLYATCTTAAATAAKVATCDGFTLSTGAVVAVKFTYINTAASPTLNVNGTGAKSIAAYGTTALPVNAWTAGAVVAFVYDGTRWIMLTALASRLATARTIQVNLASTAAASFDGSANVAPGVSNILQVNNGGTGVSSLAALKTALGISDGAKIEVGTYSGNALVSSETPQEVPVAFAPSFVWVGCLEPRIMYPWYYYSDYDDTQSPVTSVEGQVYSAYAIPNYPYCGYSEVSNGRIECLTVTTTGFSVCNTRDQSDTTKAAYNELFYLNRSGYTYFYLAIG